MRMCSRQTEAPTILMQSWGRVFGHRFRHNVMFNEMLDICPFLVAPLAAKCGGDTLKTQLKLAKWDTPRTRAHNIATHTWSPDIQRNERRIRHIAPRCRACCDLQRNQTLVLCNSSQLRHTEKHVGKPHRGKDDVGASWELHASTVNRLSKSPTASFTTQDEARLATTAFAEKLPAVPHTHHKRTCSHAQPTSTITTC